MQVTLRKAFSWLSVLVTFTAYAFNYPDVTITGKITDGSSGTPLSYAQVQVQRTNCADGSSAIHSDHQGSYELNVQVDGDAGCQMIITFANEGYVSRRFTIDASKLVAKQADEQVWTIDLQVQLWREGSKGAKATSLGKCTYVQDIQNFTCKGEAAINTRMDEDLLGIKGKIDGIGNDLVVYGRVETLFGDHPLKDTEIMIFSEKNELIRATNADRNGNYFFRLEYDRVALVTYQLKGFVSKTIVFDTHAVPLNEQADGFAANVDVKLFEPIPGEDLSFLQEPMGRSAFDPETINFRWDLAVTMPVKERLDAIIQRHIERQRADP